MKRVKITDGLYGYRPEGAKHPQPVSAGGTCLVDDEEAARLVELRVGVVVGDVPSDDISSAVATPAEDEEAAHLDPEQLKELTNAKLKELAEEMGIDTAKLKTKAQLIAAITDIPLEDAIPDEEEDAPPDLGAEGPVT